MNFDPDQLMYVYGITKDNPIAHVINEGYYDKDRSSWVRTLCGVPLSFSMKGAVLPGKHAFRFAAACAVCQQAQMELESV